MEGVEADHNAVIQQIWQCIKMYSYAKWNDQSHQVKLRKTLITEAQQQFLKDFGTKKRLFHLDNAQLIVLRWPQQLHGTPTSIDSQYARHIEDVLFTVGSLILD
jgi:hypothetical protein